MTWSWKLGRMFGIDVYMHATFLVLLAWIGLMHWTAEQSLAAVAWGIVFVLALFGCVVLHEFGHALTARRYGIATRDITLLPIGGLARLERMPEEPIQEFWVAIAGPAVNLVIAGVLFAWIAVFGEWQPVEELGVGGGSFLERLLFINILLMVFNLLPAFPMDGGRVLRALLATCMDYARATQHAATVGQGMAIFFGFVGLMGNPILIFIALFVWIGATQEAQMVQMKSSLAGIPLRHAMLTHFRTLSPDDTLETAVDLILTGEQQDFPVVEAGEVLGILTRGALVEALPRVGRDEPVRGVMLRDFQVAQPSEMLENVLMRLQGCNCRTLPVVHGDRLVGMITMDNIGEFLMIQAAARGAAGAGRQPVL
jgi:Zn-dependent protease